MRLLIIILCALLFAGCADKNLTMKGVQAFDAENYTTAYEELAPLAVRGDPEAQFYVAKMHYFGFGIPKDLDIAFIRYTDSAEQGYMKAQHNLGLMYINGLSTDTNPELGYEWIAKAAAQGFAISQFMMGVALTMEGSPLQQDTTRGLEYYEAAALQNYPEALTQLGEHFAFREVNYSKAGDYFDKGAALGDPQAMHRLSYIYMGGTLRTQDKERAHNLLKTSAEKKYLPSYYDLAMSYFLGNGVTQSAEQGIKWMKKSAIEANNALAQFNLGAMYDKGEDVPENNAEAVKWYRKAADQGNAVAQSNLGDMYVKGEGVPGNHAEAVKWFRKAADQGNAAAQNSLGVMYVKGEGVPENHAEAVKWYRKAADQGNAAAQSNLGHKYVKGEGVPENHAEAVKWFRKAADQGNAAAQTSLGVMYGKGEGVPENHAEAVKWNRKAADQGYAPAQFNLGAWYYYGQGVPENHAEAVKWFRKAADQGDARSQAQLGIHLMKGDGILKDPDRGIQLLTEAAKNGGIDAQYFLGLIYSVGSQEAGLGRYIETDEKKAKYWLSMAIAQGDSRADEVLLVLNAELKARKEEAARQQEIYRLERIARFEKAQREKRAAEKQLAEYKRQQEYQARQPKRPSLVESFIGGLFEAAVDGAVMYGQAKINKELGIKSPQERQLDDFRRVADEENERMLRLIRKERRMEKIMKDLRTTPSIGYKN